MPKNKLFYDLFEEVAVTVFTMGGVLKQLVNEPDFDKNKVMRPRFATC